MLDGWLNKIGLSLNVDVVVGNVLYDISAICNMRL
jgi:hypothetical protein